MNDLNPNIRHKFLLTLSIYITSEILLCCSLSGLSKAVAGWVPISPLGTKP